MCPYFPPSIALLPPLSQEQRLEFALHFAIQCLWVRCACLPSDVAENRDSADLQTLSAPNLALTPSSCLEKTALGGSQMHLENWPLCYSPAQFLASFSDLLKVLLMSVSGESPACELVRLLCSTRASACPAPASAWPSARGRSDASVRIPAGSSSPQGHSRSCTCRPAGAAGVPGRALCRCPANNLVLCLRF